MTRAEIAERKAQLVARAALERMRLTIAVQAVRQQVMPPAAPASLIRRPIVAMLVAFAVRRLGTARLRRALRVVSYATAAYRIVSNLRR
jgi:hypothetical protein